jgi:hypothetical protein
LNIKPQIGLYISTLGSLHSCTFLTFQYHHPRAYNFYQSHFGSRVISGQVSGHLVSGHFGFRIVSGRVGSGIRSFQILGRIRSGWVGYRIISSFGSYQVGSGRVLDRSMSDYFRLWIVSNQNRSDEFFELSRVLPPLITLSVGIKSSQ